MLMSQVTTFPCVQLLGLPLASQHQALLPREMLLGPLGPPTQGPERPHAAVQSVHWGTGGWEGAECGYGSSCSGGWIQGRDQEGWGGGGSRLNILQHCGREHT